MNCSNPHCWENRPDCKNCPYRIKSHVEPKLDGVKCINSIAKIYLILLITLIILS